MHLVEKPRRPDAHIDPFLAFDQDTFDQLHGASSFVLEDFFGFTFSPNLTETVPEPTTILLLGLGLAGLGFAKRRLH